MARKLALANMRKAVKAAAGEEQDPAALSPGHMRLYRFYQPSLQPGLYGIEAKQTITSVVDGQTSTIYVFNYQTSAATNLPAQPDNPNAPTAVQQFNVIAPQFQIQPHVINSVYPPPGYTDEGRVLPHIAFNDPHIPWDRTLPFPTSADTSRPAALPVLADLPSWIQPATASTLYATGDTRAAAGGEISRAVDRPNPQLLPWMALVVFDVDELKLTSSDESTLGIPAPTTTQTPAVGTPTTGQPQQVAPSSGQVSTPGAYAMTVGQYLTNITSRVSYDAGYSPTVFQQMQKSVDPTCIIFPKKTLVSTIFLPTYQFLLMSHVRQINTTGFPDAGVEEDGLYSVSISKRSGPTSYPSTNPNPIPVTQVVHLVSLEYLQESNLTIDGPSDRVGLVSLYSWTYLSVPPNPINFQTIMTNLANNMQMLRTPEPALTSLSNSIPTQKTPELQAAAQQLYDRLSLGYTIGRWRTSVGEETVAFTRGPLTPLRTPWKPSVASDWLGSSNSGKDYQILDQDLGVMDVSYSSAWQLGKLMAISDNIFNSALLRFRSLVHEAAASDTRKQLNSVLSKSAVLAQIPNAIDELHNTTDGNRRPARIVLPSSDKVAPPLSHPRVAKVFKNNLIRIIDAQTAAGEALFTDLNLGQANNSDWEIIYKWISDKLFLGGIPAHYLLPDPSLLSSEALRFFYIDSAWIDCFIDGALSVANHLEPVDDKVRRRIKDVYNVFLRTPVPPTTLKPQVPEYGFILRSALLKVMPDMRVTVTCRKATATGLVEDDARRPLVRLTKIDDNTLMGLLDCMPEEIYQIVFAQPPHQQRFVAAAQLDPTPIYHITQLFTQNAPEGTGEAGKWPPLDPTKVPAATEMAKWYDKDSRCVEIITMAEDITNALNTTAPNFQGTVDAVVLALELNDLSYQLQIEPPPKSDLSTVPTQDRQLWVGVDIDDPDDPIPPAHPVVIQGPQIPIPPIPGVSHPLATGSQPAPTDSRPTPVTSSPLSTHPSKPPSLGSGSTASGPGFAHAAQPPPAAYPTPLTSRPTPLTGHPNPQAPSPKIPSKPAPSASPTSPKPSSATQPASQHALRHRDLSAQGPLHHDPPHHGPIHQRPPHSFQQSPPRGTPAAAEYHQPPPFSQPSSQGEGRSHGSRSITVHPPTFARKTMSTAPKLNLSAARLLPRQRHANSPPVSGSGSAPPQLTPQFTLAIHTDYRGAAPLPYIAPDGTTTYSSTDFVPTATQTLFDLIFSLHHLSVATPLPYPLLQLSVLLPTDTSPAATVEPLLTGTYAGPGADMLHNKRFITTLLAQPGILEIRLTPRDTLSATSSTSTTSTSTGATAGGSATTPPTTVPVAAAVDGSFRLAQVLIAPIKTPVNVIVLGDKPGGPVSRRSLCPVRVMETYLMSDGTTAVVGSTGTVVKREGGDVDSLGNAV